MERILAWLAALAAQGAGVAPLPPAPPPAAAIDPAEDEWALAQAETRMTVPVSIAGKGDWPFVIDTGAERTVVSRELADTLSLLPGRTVRVTTMAGTAPTPTALVPLLKISRLTPPLIEAPVYARRYIGAQGMLGLDALQGHRIAIDFDRDRMTLTPTTRRSRIERREADEIVVVARSRFGQLIVTDARWRGRRISVVIDTGSSVTLANAAFGKLLGKAPSLGTWQMMAASGERFTAPAVRLDRLQIGGIGLTGVPIAVSDVAPFARFGLTQRPALLLGMQTLRAFRKVEIDFPNRAIRFTTASDSRMAAR